MSISTRTGDDGTSGLLFNRRVSKTNARIEAYGSVDELNAALGMVRAAAGPGPLNEQILRIQNELVIVMGDLALLDEDRPRYEEKRGYIGPDATDRLTAIVHEGEKKVSITHWVTPGGNAVGAACDFARTVCRRAERRVLMVREQGTTVNPEIIHYLNRLSDVCFIWARLTEVRGSEAP
jgi:cob(I)alamin adenosyltransferase